MRFYNATQFLFPRHFEWRLLLLCFIAVHTPLLGVIAYEALSGHWDTATTLIVLAMTVVGTVLGLGAIHGLLSPVRKSIAMLKAIQNGEHPEPLDIAASEDLVGQLLHSVKTAREETALRLYTLETLSEFDPLTGIRNRRGFTNAAVKALSGDKNAVIALIDIDHFKLVNDRFGHEAGDILLRNIALAIEGNLRRSDVCCRWGGEEFAILFPDTLLDEARMVMERLRASIALDSNLLDESWPITLSCGIAPLRAFDELAEAARRADSALYDAKESGRNRVRVARL